MSIIPYIDATLAFCSRLCWAKCAEKQTAQTLGKQTLICIETEAPITTSVLPQRPQWGKQEAGRPPSIEPPPSLSPFCHCQPLRRELCQTTRPLVTKHVLWWIHREAAEGVSSAKRVARRMPLSYYFFVLCVRGRLEPICSAAEQAWPHLFATRVLGVINLRERTFSEIKPPFISP